MGWQATLTFLRWGPKFKLHRRVLQRAFSQSNCVHYRELQTKEAHTLLRGILASPSNWETILRRFATAIVMGIGFGVDIHSDDDPYIKIATDASYALGHGGAPAGTPVDFFPLLRWLPDMICSSRSLRFARDWRWSIRKIHDAPFAAATKQTASETDSISFIHGLLRQQEAGGDQDAQAFTLEDIKGAAGAVFAAGQDTTWSTLVVFILNMVLHPEIQQKAQGIIDQVVGIERLPTFEDRPKLQYIDYIVQETLRWGPVSPIGVPHRSLQDDEYNGMFIPAGSYVYANARAMTHDERTYHNPDQFCPDRFAPTSEGGAGEPFPVGQFGFGRDAVAYAPNVCTNEDSLHALAVTEPAVLAKHFRTPDAIVVQQRDLLKCVRSDHADLPGSQRTPSRSQESVSEHRLRTPDTGLPPHNDLIQGCRVFLASYFQLGFIPKTLFLERLSKNAEAASSFLLAAILAISARFTPALVARYGGINEVTSHFMRLTAGMVPHEMYQVDLEHVQAFFLLSIAEWGNGDKNRSIVHMGIAVKMATILRLHREETYELPASATREAIVEAEIGRRTFWMLQSQDNLHSSHSTPVAFSPSDVTALLPCSENAFAFGVLPRCRAAVPGTAAAMRDPSSVAPAQRSLFATLVQAHNYWGIVARRACKADDGSTNVMSRPADASSDYRRLADELETWEEGLPDQHKWSVWNLRGYKAEGMELAYLATVMVIRLSNIVLRRIYLDDLLTASRTDFDVGSDHAAFWQAMSYELFDNMLELHRQIAAYFASRLKADGYPAILAFCVYTCGSVAAHLLKWPQLCPSLAAEAPRIATHSLTVLSELQHAWPTAARWQSGLQQVATPILEIPSAWTAVGSLPRARRAYRAAGASRGAGSNASPTRVSSSQELQDRSSPGNPGSSDHSVPGQNLGQYHDSHCVSEAIGSFEAELAALLHGDTYSGDAGGWEISNNF
ncbi:Cytochrome-P450 monooxygenase [Teratosphaeria destructans]|uniref:Cytochrome-P450 monooxygenase n=1 Tax=Teratosphaeria destructans TaxID=418781 RepID=A0A9W7SUZ2_9PEZI|nr:Cytochrome-P450 monooxygenase [Teratosphaeria destructans]